MVILQLTNVRIIGYTKNKQSILIKSASKHQISCTYRYSCWQYWTFFFIYFFKFYSIVLNLGSFDNNLYPCREKKNCTQTISHLMMFILHMTKLVKLVQFDHLITDNILWLPEWKRTTNVSYDRYSLTQHINDKYKDIYNDPQLKATEAMLPLLSKPVVFG